VADVEVAVVVEAAVAADRWEVAADVRWEVVVLDPVVECREAALVPVAECPAVVRGRVACQAEVQDQVVECPIVRRRLIRRVAAVVRLNCLEADRED
jgi:hypothetical protein